MSKLIKLSEILETKVRKEKELAYYQKQMEKLEQRMYFIKKDIDLTKIIIDIIEKEKVYDIKQQMIEKRKLKRTIKIN